MISLLRNHLRPESPFHFFNVSVVLPFYGKLTVFKKVLPQNASYYQRNGIEVVIILDEPSEEKELLSLIKVYPFINWKVIINRQEHEWRNPSKVINVGIRNASMRYIMVMSPDSEFHTDVIFQLRECLMYYPSSFAIGQILFTAFDKEADFGQKSMHPFGSIMVEKSFLEQVGGYDERLSKWSKDDADVRARLEIAGLRKMFIKDAILIHRENADELTGKVQKVFLPIKEKFRLSHPPRINANGDNWGYDFNEACYDWQTDRFDIEQCHNYLVQFVKHSELTEDILKTKRNVILLASVYNESELLPDFIKHMSNFCNGIIFLDDGSNDNSYELVQGEKVLLKVKKERLFFNDIGNRNILLDIAYFFNTEWLMFMDVDERFDERYCDLNSLLIQDEYDVFAFKFVHLWNSCNTYNVDFPRTEDGIVKTNRMFRSKGYLQINSRRTLHFPSVPYFDRINMDVPVLVLHSGNLSETSRQKKYSFYQHEDKTKEVYDYEYLISKNCTLKNINDIQL